ncbi:MAG: NAD(P)H-dependent oxidoreductase [Oscillochloris sp.]|nr:NAD(P)H-dependent oxidoreductase [Oscillochloris sp.]
MSDPLKILAVSGSLRHNSLNTALLHAAQEVAPAHVQIELYDLADIPLYNGDEDGGEHGQPAGVGRFKAALGAADAIMIATPEYNYSIPGVLKNAIDWASRPIASSPLNGKPLAMMGAGGMSGTMRAQFHLRQILVHNNMLVLNKPELYVVRAWEKFDSERNLTDEPTREQLRKLVEALVAWTRRVG